MQPLIPSHHNETHSNNKPLCFNINCKAATPVALLVACGFAVLGIHRFCHPQLSNGVESFIAAATITAYVFANLVKCPSSRQRKPSTTSHHYGTFSAKENIQSNRTVVTLRRIINFLEYDVSLPEVGESPQETRLWKELAGYYNQSQTSDFGSEDSDHLLMESPVDQYDA